MNKILNFMTKVIIYVYVILGFLYMMLLAAENVMDYVESKKNNS